MADTKPCIACGNNIPAAAIKCAKCSAYQNWRRFLGVSTNMLSLLVALVAVLGATVPVLIESLESDDAVVNVTPLDVEYVRSRQGEQLVIVASFRFFLNTQYEPPAKRFR